MCFVGLHVLVEDSLVASALHRTISLTARLTYHGMLQSLDLAMAACILLDIFKLLVQWSWLAPRPENQMNEMNE